MSRKMRIGSSRRRQKDHREGKTETDDSHVCREGKRDDTALSDSHKTEPLSDAMGEKRRPWSTRRHRERQDLNELMVEAAQNICEEISDAAPSEAKSSDLHQLTDNLEADRHTPGMDALLVQSEFTPPDLKHCRLTELCRDDAHTSASTVADTGEASDIEVEQRESRSTEESIQAGPEPKMSTNQNQQIESKLDLQVLAEFHTIQSENVGEVIYGEFSEINQLGLNASLPQVLTTMSELLSENQVHIIGQGTQGTDRLGRLSSIAEEIPGRDMEEEQYFGNLQEESMMSESLDMPMVELEIKTEVIAGGTGSPVCVRGPGSGYEYDITTPESLDQSDSTLLGEVTLTEDTENLESFFSPIPFPRLYQSESESSYRETETCGSPTEKRELKPVDDHTQDTQESIAQFRDPNVDLIEDVPDSTVSEPNILNPNDNKDTNPSGQISLKLLNREHNENFVDLSEARTETRQTKEATELYQMHHGNSQEGRDAGSVAVDTELQDPGLPHGRSEEVNFTFLTLVSPAQKTGPVHEACARVYMPDRPECESESRAPPFGEVEQSEEALLTADDSVLLSISELTGTGQTSGQDANALTSYQSDDIPSSYSNISDRLRDLTTVYGETLHQSGGSVNTPLSSPLLEENSNMDPDTTGRRRKMGSTRRSQRGRRGQEHTEERGGENATIPRIIREVEDSIITEPTASIEKIEFRDSTENVREEEREREMKSGTDRIADLDRDKGFEVGELQQSENKLSPEENNDHTLPERHASYLDDKEDLSGQEKKEEREIENPADDHYAGEEKLQQLGDPAKSENIVQNFSTSHDDAYNESLPMSFSDTVPEDRFSQTLEAKISSLIDLPEVHISVQSFDSNVADARWSDDAERIPEEPCPESLPPVSSVCHGESAHAESNTRGKRRKMGSTRRSQRGRQGQEHMEERGGEDATSGQETKELVEQEGAKEIFQDWVEEPNVEPVTVEDMHDSANNEAHAARCEDTEKEYVYADEVKDIMEGSMRGTGTSDMEVENPAYDHYTVEEKLQQIRNPATSEDIIPNFSTSHDDTSNESLPMSFSDTVPEDSSSQQLEVKMSSFIDLPEVHISVQIDSNVADASRSDDAERIPEEPCLESLPPVSSVCHGESAHAESNTRGKRRKMGSTRRSQRGRQGQEHTEERGGEDATIPRTIGEVEDSIITEPTASVEKIEFRDSTENVRGEEREREDKLQQLGNPAKSEAIVQNFSTSHDDTSNESLPMSFSDTIPEDSSSQPLEVKMSSFIDHPEVHISVQIDSNVADASRSDDAERIPEEPSPESLTPVSSVCHGESAHAESNTRGKRRKMGSTRRSQRGRQGQEHMEERGGEDATSGRETKELVEQEGAKEIFQDWVEEPNVEPVAVEDMHDSANNEAHAARCEDTEKEYVYADEVKDIMEGSMRGTGTSYMEVENPAYDHYTVEEKLQQLRNPATSEDIIQNFSNSHDDTSNESLPMSFSDTVPEDSSSQQLEVKMSSFIDLPEVHISVQIDSNVANASRSDDAERIPEEPCLESLPPVSSVCHGESAHAESNTRGKRRKMGSTRRSQRGRQGQEHTEERGGEDATIPRTITEPTASVEKIELRDYTENVRGEEREREDKLQQLGNPAKSEAIVQNFSTSHDDTSNESLPMSFSDTIPEDSSSQPLEVKMSSFIDHPEVHISVQIDSNVADASRSDDAERIPEEPSPESLTPVSSVCHGESAHAESNTRGKRRKMGSTRRSQRGRQGQEHMEERGGEDATSGRETKELVEQEGAKEIFQDWVEEPNVEPVAVEDMHDSANNEAHAARCEDTEKEYVYADEVKDIMEGSMRGTGTSDMEVENPAYDHYTVEEKLQQLRNPATSEDIIQNFSNSHDDTSNESLPMSFSDTVPEDSSSQQLEVKMSSFIDLPEVHISVQIDSNVANASRSDDAERIPEEPSPESLTPVSSVCHGESAHAESNTRGKRRKMGSSRRSQLGRHRDKSNGEKPKEEVIEPDDGPSAAQKNERKDATVDTTCHNILIQSLKHEQTSNESVDTYETGDSAGLLHNKENVGKKANMDPGTTGRRRNMEMKPGERQEQTREERQEEDRDRELVFSSSISNIDTVSIKIDIPDERQENTEAKVTGRRRKMGSTRMTKVLHREGEQQETPASENKDKMENEEKKEQTGNEGESVEGKGKKMGSRRHGQGKDILEEDEDEKSRHIERLLHDAPCLREDPEDTESAGHRLPEQLESTPDVSVGNTKRPAELVEKSLVTKAKRQPLAGNPDSGESHYNVMMVGNASVGKTTFFKRLQSGEFCSDLCASVGIDICKQSLTVDGKPVTLHLWDTAGQERYRSITHQVFHKAQVILLMYDITSCQSFSDVCYWLSCIQEGASDDVIIMLLGNKSDCAQRQVQSQDGECLAKEYNILFMECSAATGDNVLKSLETVTRMMRQKAEKSGTGSMVLHKEPPVKKSSGCC